jgi:hypothetical protein
MSYIGSKPADAVLETDDITDGVITTSKLADNSVTTAKTSYSDIPHRNIIINGDMSIAQRSTSVAGITSAGYYTVDRFQIFNNTLGTWTQSQDTDVPSGQGFAKSLKMDCTTADASPSANDYLWFEQRIEGQNLQYLKKGTSSAESLTLSFWVKSNKTGTYIAELRDSDNTRQISKSYTISASNTWEKKTITYTGDTTGAFTNDNGLSLTLILWLGAGSNLTSGTLNTSWNATTTANRAVGQVNLADSTSNEWYITGVQLEAGTSASDFEFLPHDVNLQRCQRYYQNIVSGNNEPVCFGFYNGASSLVVTIPFQTSMRTDPTLDSNIESTLTVDRNGGNETITSLTLNRSDKSKASLYNNSVSSTSGVGAKVRTDSSGDSISFDAEL